MEVVVAWVRSTGRWRCELARSSARKSRGVLAVAGAAATGVADGSAT